MTVAFFCEHGAHRAAIGAAIALISVGYPGSLVCDMIEATRYVADLSSCHQGKSSARSRLIAYEQLLQSNVHGPLAVMPSMGYASRSRRCSGRCKLQASSNALVPENTV